MYSPFFDKKGKALSIQKLKYEHLSQLQDCDEGHHLEYKSLLEDGGKFQLAKEIASFANCEGGWLIVGIDDKSKTIIPIEKKDYSQKIGKIATRISPMPEFETKFLCLPENKNQGVLIIYVYEGRNAPYICNGSIYIRSGSSKEPIKAADRGNIEYLYERSKYYLQEIEKFCKRDYFYSYNNLIHQKTTYPIANIYIKNVSSKRNTYFNLYANRDKFIDYVRSKYNVFENVSYSMESIIFKHKNILPNTNSTTFVIEVFYDWSCKITFAIGVSEDEKSGLFHQLLSLGYGLKTVENLQIASGSSTFSSIFFGMVMFANIANTYKLREEDYAYCVEVENAGETVVVFLGEEYKNYVKQYGLPYAHKELNRSEIIFLRDIPKITFDELASSAVRDDFGAALGFRSDSIFKLIDGANKK